MVVPSRFLATGTVIVSRSPPGGAEMSQPFQASEYPWFIKNAPPASAAVVGLLPPLDRLNGPNSFVPRLFTSMNSLWLPFGRSMGLKRKEVHRVPDGAGSRPRRESDIDDHAIAGIGRVHLSEGDAPDLFVRADAPVHPEGRASQRRPLDAGDHDTGDAGFGGERGHREAKREPRNDLCHGFSPPAEGGAAPTCASARGVRLSVGDVNPRRPVESAKDYRLRPRVVPCSG